MRPRTFTDDELLATARRCFLEHGPHVSTTIIARELGVSAAALFRRVGSKSELLRRALGLPQCPQWVMDLERGPDERPVAAQLGELATRIDEFFATRLPALAVFRAAGIDPSELFADMPEPPPVRAVRAMRSWFDALVAAGRIAAVDTAAIAVAFLGSLQSRHMLQQVCGAGYPDGGPRFLQTVTETFIAALVPNDEDPRTC